MLALCANAARMEHSGGQDAPPKTTPEIGQAAPRNRSR